MSDTNCTACPAGLTTSSTGATSNSQCGIIIITIIFIIIVIIVDVTILGLYGNTWTTSPSITGQWEAIASDRYYYNYYH